MQVVHEHNSIKYLYYMWYLLTYSIQEADIILSGAWLLLFGILLTPWVVVTQQSDLNSDTVTEQWQSFFQKSGNKKQAETPQNAYVNAEQWIIGKQVTFREILLKKILQHLFM